MELRSRKNGKQDKIVVQKAEAEKLTPGRTKDDRIRKSGSQAKEDRIVVQKAEAEKLTPGRTKDDRIRKSGSQAKEDPIVVQKAEAEKLTPGRTKDDRVRKSGSQAKEDLIVVEKAEAEELPPGWTKDIKIRKSGSTTKKDPYYKDPVTGYTFRSLKDVQRYLKTGELGRLAIKPKDSEDENLHTQAGCDLHKLPERETDDPMAGQQNSSLVEMKSDENMVESTGSEEHTIVSENASEPHKKVAEMSGINLPETKGSEAKEGKENTAVRDVNALEANKLEKKEEKRETSQKKRPPENGSEGHKKKNKSSEGSEPVLPRRASKRLAGVEIDTPPPSPPEPRTRRHTSANRSRESKTNLATSIECNEGKMAKSTSRELDPSEHNENVTKKEDMEADNKQNFPVVSPPLTPLTLKEHDKEIKSENLTKEKPLSPTKDNNSSDKTDYNAPSVVPPLNFEVKMDNKPLGNQETPVVNPSTSYNIGDTPDAKPESPMNFSMNDLWTDPCIEFAVKTLTGAIPIEDLNKPNVTTPSLDLSLEDMWTDPCIEFAVKTLTGAIPVKEDLSVQDYLQPQSQQKSQQSFSLPDVGVNNFCQTDLLSNHFEIAETSRNYKNQDPVAYRNGSLQNSGNQGLPQKVKGSSGQCSIPR